MEKVRSDFALETETHCGSIGDPAGLQSARGPGGSSTNTLNFSLRNWGTEIRYGLPGALRWSAIEMIEGRLRRPAGMYRKRCCCSLSIAFHNC